MDRDLQTTHTWEDGNLRIEMRGGEEGRMNARSAKLAEIQRRQGHLSSEGGRRARTALRERSQLVTPPNSNQETKFAI